MENIKYTTSTYSNRVVRGTHLFMIADYSLHKEIGVGQFIRSTIFNIGGYDWAIRYYPDGLNNRNKKFIAIYVELVTENVEVRAQFCIRLMGIPENTEWAVIGVTKVSTKEGSKTRVSGYDKFFERSALEAWESLKHDRFVIECQIAVVSDPMSETDQPRPSSEVISVPPSALSNDLAKMLVSKVGADLIFSVQDKTIDAHRAVLVARSTVFRAELRGLPVMENEEPLRITVEDVSPDVFGAVVYFLYTDNMHFMQDFYGAYRTREFLRRLLQAADQYAVERLKIICESILCKTLDVEIVATTFVLAVKHNCNHLKEACLMYMVYPGRMKKVMATQDYESLRSKTPELAVEVMESVCKFRPKKNN